MAQPHGVTDSLPKVDIETDHSFAGIMVFDGVPAEPNGGRLTGGPNVRSDSDRQPGPRGPHTLLMI